jgi:hypothetical protein
MGSPKTFLFQMAKLKKSCEDSKTDIALCYVTVYLALIYNNSDRIMLNESEVMTFVDRLVDEALKRPKVH